jgi:TonB family protein
VAILTLLVVHSDLAHSTEISDRRKSTTQQMKKEFSRLGIHKLYIPDFCDSGRVNGPGALFASIFSLWLKDAKDFTVLSRVDVHRFLIENHWTDCDLSNPDALLKLSKEFGVDSILAGRLVPVNKSFSIDFVLRDLSGKELTRLNYSEPFEAQTIGMFPAISAASGWPFVLPGYDGVSLPRAIRMTSPPYTERARAAHISGRVAISAIVTTEGKVEQARVVQKVDPGLDKISLETANTWTFEPAKGPDGTLVPVRIVFEVNFALYQ